MSILASRDISYIKMVESFNHIPKKMFVRSQIDVLSLKLIFPTHYCCIWEHRIFLKKIIKIVFLKKKVNRIFDFFSSFFGYFWKNSFFYIQPDPNLKLPTYIVGYAIKNIIIFWYVDLYCHNFLLHFLQSYHYLVYP